MFPLLLAAAAVLPASPIEQQKWFTSQEHPKTALAVAERGFVAYTIDVAPDGSALRCEPQDKGDLDRKVCELVMKRARFRPAADDQGRPVFGVHEAVASFLLPGKGRARPDRSKLAVMVDRLPDGVAGPAFARVAFLVDAAGVISQCTNAAGEQRRFQQSVPALAPAACDAVVKDYRPAPVRDAAGIPVASVQSAMVRFETGKAP